MRGFNFAHAAILAGVPGFGENVFPLERLGTNGDHWNRSKLMGRFRKDRSLHYRCECREWVFIVLLIVLHACELFVRFTFVCVNLNNVSSDIPIMHPEK
jgi:hypothetical protein